MDIPEDNQKNRTNDKNKKDSKDSNSGNLVLFIVLITIVISTAGIAYLNSSGIDIKNISISKLLEDKLFLKDKSEIEIITSEFKFDVNMHVEFCTHKGFIVKSTRDGLVYLDSKGEEVWTYPISFNKPLLKSSGDYLLIADLGGKDVIVFSEKNKLWEKKIDDKIINADISKSGYVSVVHEMERTWSTVSVFNRQGMNMFKRGKADNYIISSKVSPSGKIVFINSIYISGINTSTLLEITDITGNNLAGESPEENIIFSKIMYIDDNNLFALADSELKMLGNDMELKWKIPVEGQIYSSCIADDKYEVVAVSSNESSGILGSEKTDVLVFDINGKQVFNYKVNEEVKNINAYNDLIAINTSKHIYFMNVEGKIIGKYNSQRAAQSRLLTPAAR